MDFGTLLSAYGLPGIIIFALGVVVVHLYRENKALTDKLLDQSEARRIEGLEREKAIAGTMSSFSQSTEQLIAKIRIVRGEQ